MVSVSTKTQKRLAASILKCGKRRIFIDPSEQGEISTANSRQSIRKIIQDQAGITKKVCSPVSSTWCCSARCADATPPRADLRATPDSREMWERRREMAPTDHRQKPPLLLRKRLLRISGPMTHVIPLHFFTLITLAGYHRALQVQTPSVSGGQVQGPPHRLR